MLTYWETLTAIQSNTPVNDSYAQLWGRKLLNAYTVVTYTGTLPAILTGTKAGYLESYTIYGNTVQTGTPTPENPIMPIGCGELETTGANAGQYKLPLTSAGQDVDIYLGEVETTRRIKKLVLTGEENITFSSEDDNRIVGLFTIPDMGMIYTVSGYCNILIWKSVYSQNEYNRIVAYTPQRFYMSLAKAILPEPTIDGFKSYLAAQYAAGTPVTVWYVLAEPETAVVNEPLMKIGGYADTVSMEQSGVSIPTLAGETTIEWAGDGLAPSEVEFVYKVKR